MAVRELDLPGGTWVMRDDVVRSPAGGVTDRLGSPAILAATFDVAVVGDALELTSRTLGLALGPLRLRVPRVVSPTVRLQESFDAASGRQRVDLTVVHPLLGRLYGYNGLFTYRIEKEPA
ncbi:hypothetical protein GCM10025875_03860 [Litorihabitans aurantiacus]|uniref:DUF4166 domain-containing protein n=1 Tax=Litorihabitans aurantiacus TaxID=1930061 RepID=A0AA37ULU2_9MICO|nr:hypothetical protein GCM10025875_03860 [Litorihabitans aurantiacus]